MPLHIKENTIFQNIELIGNKSQNLQNEAARDHQTLNPWMDQKPKTSNHFPLQKVIKSP